MLDIRGMSSLSDRVPGRNIFDETLLQLALVLSMLSPIIVYIKSKIDAAKIQRLLFYPVYRSRSRQACLRNEARNLLSRANFVAGLKLLQPILEGEQGVVIVDPIYLSENCYPVKAFSCYQQSNGSLELRFHLTTADYPRLMDMCRDSLRDLVSEHGIMMSRCYYNPVICVRLLPKVNPYGALKALHANNMVSPFLYNAILLESHPDLRPWAERASLTLCPRVGFNLKPSLKKHASNLAGLILLWSVTSLIGKYLSHLGFVDAHFDALLPCSLWLAIFTVQVWREDEVRGLQQALHEVRYDILGTHNFKYQLSIELDTRVKLAEDVKRARATLLKGVELPVCPITQNCPGIPVFDPACPQQTMDAESLLEWYRKSTKHPVTQAFMSGVVIDTKLFRKIHGESYRDQLNQFELEQASAPSWGSWFTEKLSLFANTVIRVESAQKLPNMGLG